MNIDLQRNKQFQKFQKIQVQLFMQLSFEIVQNLYISGDLLSLWHNFASPAQALVQCEGAGLASHTVCALSISSNPIKPIAII